MIGQFSRPKWKLGLIFWLLLYLKIMNSYQPRDCLLQVLGGCLNTCLIGTLCRGWIPGILCHNFIIKHRVNNFEITSKKPIRAIQSLVIIIFWDIVRINGWTHLVIIWTHFGIFNIFFWTLRGDNMNNGRLLTVNSITWSGNCGLITVRTQKIFFIWPWIKVY